jgi:hypothetical protein
MHFPARQQADKGIQGRMEGHAAMDMSNHEGTIRQWMFSSKGRTAISHFFVMDWVMIWIDLKISLFLLAIFYLAMAAAALVVEFVFQILHLIPQERKAQIVEGTIRWNYTTILNIVFSGACVGSGDSLLPHWRACDDAHDERSGPSRRGSCPVATLK